MKYKYVLLTLFLCIFFFGGGYYYSNRQANVSFDKEKEKVPSDSEISAGTNPSSDTNSTSKSQSNNNPRSETEENSPSQAEDTSLSQAKQTEEDPTTKYSSCLEFSEPFLETNGQFWTVIVQVKNNCGVDLNSIEVAFVGESNKRNRVEEQNGSLSSLSAGEVKSIRASFEEINPDQVDWKITSITE